MPLSDDEKATLRDVQQALAHAERSIDAASIKVRSLVGPIRRNRGTGGQGGGQGSDRDQ